MAGLGGGATSLSMAGSGGFNTPFTLTLESSDSTRLGDTTSVQNTWWGTQTYDSV